MKKGIHILLVTALLLSFITTEEAMAQCQPVARYPMNGNGLDYSGNGNHGMLKGPKVPIPVPDRFGNPNSALLFRGVNKEGWIEIPNSPSLQLNQTLSISLWFRQCEFKGMDGNGQPTSNGFFALVCKAGDGYSADPGYWIWTHTDANGKLQLYFSNKNGQDSSTTNFNESIIYNCFDSCEWLNVIGVVDYDQWKVYINGELSGQATINPADFTAANNQKLYIGRMGGGASIWYPFYGVIDDVTIYNCALSEQEVAAIAGNYSDPLAYNNTIHLNSIDVIPVSCNNPHNASISFNVDNPMSGTQYSIDGGLTFQLSSVFSGLDTGHYEIVIESPCTTLDTVIVVKDETYNDTTHIVICNELPYILPSGDTVDIDGIYIDSLTTTGGCDSIIITDLIYSTEVTVHFDTLMCAGKPFTLPAGGIATLPGIYTDTIPSVMGCDSIIILALDYSPEFTDTAVVSDVHCFGMNDGTIQLSAYGSTGPYTYEINGISLGNGYFDGLPRGNYIYTITDSRGCSKSNEVTIREPKELKIYTPGYPVITEPFTSTLLEARCNYDNARFHWSPSTGILCDSCPSTYFVADQSMRYTVEASIELNQYTCTAEGEIIVAVQPDIYVPSAFSPNNDGINDYIEIKAAHPDEMPYFLFYIFNRWGELLFQTTDPDFRWKNEDEETSFVYLAKYGVPDRFKVKSGTITAVH